MPVRVRTRARQAAPRLPLPRNGRERSPGSHGQRFGALRASCRAARERLCSAGLTWPPATGSGSCQVPLAKQKKVSAGRRPPELSIWSWHPKSGARLPRRRPAACGRRVPLPAPAALPPRRLETPQHRARSEGTAGFRGERRRPGPGDLRGSNPVPAGGRGTRPGEGVLPAEDVSRGGGGVHREGWRSYKSAGLVLASN